MSTELVITYFNEKLNERTRVPEVLFVTSYPPRECGIATYSQDLINALQDKFGNSFKCTICALESDTEQHIYKEEPKYILNIHQRNAFAKMAFQINRNANIHVVVIQHEFGFFHEKANEFKLFFNAINKPIVFVFHTVLPKPNMTLLNKVKEMAEVAISIIVMTKNSANILIDDYDVPCHLIHVIPHGTHLRIQLDKEVLKKKYDLWNRRVLSTFGLLSSGKGIETTLNALPAIIRSNPDVLFLVLGKTHPSVFKQEGEKYRKMLEEKVIQLHLSEHVRFVNEYLNLDDLLEYLHVTDIYLFTSTDRNQAVSGTFSYAVSCGCPVISTPIPHACEVLQNDVGILIDFENHTQLAEAVICLLNDEERRKNISLNGFHKMASTVWQNAALAHARLFKAINPDGLKLTYRIPEINLAHVLRMTSDFGIIQFAKLAQPDITSGYTLDDNARALIAMCQHYKLTQRSSSINLINTYLQFIRFCLQPNGKFLNYVDEYQKFTNQNYVENLDDSNGRAIWALGYLISMKDILPSSISDEAEYIFEQALPNLHTIYSTRAMAFIIKGLYYQNELRHYSLMETFADRLVRMYRHEKEEGWHWFENYLTYANSVLPEALLLAYLKIGKMTYRNIAKESFDFIVDLLFVEDRIKVISNMDWRIKGGLVTSELGGEQPIDVAYTIMALHSFYSVFDDEIYKKKMHIAFNWFLGQNHLHQIIYNPCTGGCYDGLEKCNVNLNQGAESSISYLMARLLMQNLALPEPHLMDMEVDDYVMEDQVVLV